MKTVRSLRSLKDELRCAAYLLRERPKRSAAREENGNETLLFGAAIALATLGSASAAEVEIKMLDKGTEGMMVFEPSLVKIEPGDTVKFVAVNKGHNVESIKTMMPADATPFAGKVSEDLAVSFDKPGVYGVKCLPHYGMGMVALIVVGTPPNVDEAKAVMHPGKAKQVFATLFSRLPAQTAAK